VSEPMTGTVHLIQHSPQACVMDLKNVNIFSLYFNTFSSMTVRNSEIKFHTGIVARNVVSVESEPMAYC
jgi:hypothetical protein